MTIEERSQEFFDAIKRGEDPLQDLLAKRRRKAKQRQLTKLYQDIEYCWSIGESQHNVQFQLDRITDLQEEPRYKVTEEQVTAVYYACEWMFYMNHIANENWKGELTASQMLDKASEQNVLAEVLETARRHGKKNPGLTWDEDFRVGYMEWVFD